MTGYTAALLKLLILHFWLFIAYFRYNTMAKIQDRFKKLQFRTENDFKFVPGGK